MPMARKNAEKRRIWKGEDGLFQQNGGECNVGATTRQGTSSDLHQRSSIEEGKGNRGHSETEREMGKGPSIVGKCWNGRGFFSRIEKKRKDSLKTEILGNLRCKNDLKKSWRFTS